MHRNGNGTWKLKKGQPHKLSEEKSDPTSLATWARKKSAGKIAKPMPDETSEK